MLKLYKRSLPTKTSNGLTLFWVPGGMPLMLHLEGAIAAALKLRGQKVHAIICDGIFSACVKRVITDEISIAEWGDTCAQCKKICSATLTQFGIEHSFIGDYVSCAEFKGAQELSRAETFSTVEKMQHRGVVFGKNVKSSIIRFLQGHKLPKNSDLLQAYAFSGQISAIAASNVLDKLKPSRVFMSHGSYVDWGPALHISLERAVPVTAWMASYLPSKFYFRHIPDRLNIDFHNMSDGAWKEVVSQELTAGQRVGLEKFLDDRYQHNASFDMPRLKEYVGNKHEIQNRYDLNSSKPVWGILTHINWDAVCDYAPMLYDSFDDWIIDTINIAIEVPGVQWLVKIHPAETLDNQPGTGVEALILRTFPNLPENIKLISAEEDISPLDFFELVDGAITVYGTPGLELAMKGRPVILAGDAHYGKKGFTYDAQNRRAYQDMLRQTTSIGPLEESRVDLAKKYAYCYFFSRQVPVSAVFNADAKWWGFQIGDRESLLPGMDPAIDFLCDRILDGKDFIMSPELEAKANNFMKRKT
ncbi:capsular biosynthesis protein [Alphaproteobacteria bacterium]|nr:capsular biosynthesis protein [Alphaproteobacteria bacterium]